MSSKSLTIDSNFLALWFWGNFKMFTQVVFNNPFNLSSIGALKSFNWLNCGKSKIKKRWNIYKLDGNILHFQHLIKIFPLKMWNVAIWVMCNMKSNLFSLNLFCSPKKRKTIVSDLTQSNQNSISSSHANRNSMAIVPSYTDLPKANFIQIQF